jgi:hypothetical protein
MEARLKRRGKNEKIRYSVKVAVMNINDIVGQYMGGVWTNFVSIDIEGMDLEVLESMDFSNNCPQVICIEQHDKTTYDVLNDKGFKPLFLAASNDIIAVHKSIALKYYPYL